MNEFNRNNMIFFTGVSSESFGSFVVWCVLLFVAVQLALGQLALGLGVVVIMVVGR